VVTIVREWREDEGWGVVQADELDKGIWFHFSRIDMEGYRSLRPGQRVEIRVEGPLPFEVEGYRYQATVARPLR
jgi:CspA family cold shock protein